MENIKWIFFDVGETLVSEEDSWQHRCDLQEKTNECKALNLTSKMLYDGIIEASINYLPQYMEVMRKYNIKEIIPYNALYEKLYPDTIRNLEILSKHFNLGIIANQVDGLIDRLKKWDIEKYFKVIVSSFDVKHHKPDLEIFNIALSKANAKKEESIMVGDRLDNDIYPANKLNMKTIWIKRGFGKYQKVKSKEYEPIYIINSLDELIGILLNK